MLSVNKNLGSADRALRAITAFALFIAAFIAPVPLMVSVGFALTGAYMIGTALVGTCLGYKLIGVSTCPVKQRTKQLSEK
ncbi:YgaP family membrane protein [Caulobacter henricii]|uniref:Inner membrane protein YgaP-like transmembrane domain-containing protein n=1 Tax=Caulobacter henricii TaxID=69395 RepID=A0A0N7JHR1_9CAUL|nr:DUF2892 domain-containing protein [Caulobacter henricii]ALL14098.1 hypothetical protein AQ619_12530 [Caulobacter henricii]